MPDERYTPGNRPPRRDAPPARTSYGPAPQQPRRPAPPPRRTPPPPRPAPRPTYYNAPRPKRRRRPTPFVITIVIFVLILVIVIITSNSFKNCISGQGHDSGTGGGDSTKDNGTVGAITPPESTGGQGTEAETSEPPDDDTLIIYIDPGHGFEDSGAGSDYIKPYNEKDLTLEVAKEVVDILKAKGYDARLTHDGVNFPRASTDDGNNIFSAIGADKNERSVYVNEHNVGVFVSLHCDSYPSEDIDGTRIHFCGDYQFSDSAEDLTGMLVRAIGESFNGQRMIKAFSHNGDDAYNVTRFVKAPSALIEMGFVTNPDDGACLIDPQWRSKMAAGVANGIAAFVAGYESSEE